MDEDKDKLTNTAFEAVVGVRSGYSRGLGARIKPQKRKKCCRFTWRIEKGAWKETGHRKETKRCRDSTPTRPKNDGRNDIKDWRESKTTWRESKTTWRKSGQTSWSKSGNYASSNAEYSGKYINSSFWYKI